MIASETTLFYPTFISLKVQGALPEGLLCRPLQRSDFRHGHLDALRVLTHINDITEEQWTKRFDEMVKCNGTYFIVVIMDQKREPEKMIIGTGTLTVKKKFLCNLGLQGHIEDVAIAAEYQGRKLGIKMIEALDYISEHVGSYKTLLDCSPEKESFNLKCGYARRGLEMHQYPVLLAKSYGV